MSDEDLAQEDLRRMDALIPAELRRLSKKEPYRNIRLSLVEAAEAVTRLLATIDALKAQPAPVPLAEDEALIARFKEIVTFCNTMGPRGYDESCSQVKHAIVVFPALDKLSAPRGPRSPARDGASWDFIAVWIVRTLIEDIRRRINA